MLTRCDVVCFVSLFCIASSYVLHTLLFNPKTLLLTMYVLVVINLAPFMPTCHPFCKQGATKPLASSSLSREQGREPTTAVEVVSRMNNDQSQVCDLTVTAHIFSSVPFVLYHKSQQLAVLYMPTGHALKDCLY
jgi:hypothetical protein